MKLMSGIDTFIGNQQRCPKGIVGQIIAEQMVHQHQIETSWAISLLEVQSTDHILELGFGAGKAIELIASLATSGYVAGIDLSPTMVQSASRRNAQAIKEKRVELRSGDIVQLSFPDQHFDKILSIHTIYFWSDPIRSMAEIFRVLKPGGTLVLTLSTGKMGAPEGIGLASYQRLLEEQIIPEMLRIGFTTALVKQGPLSRQFKIAAAFGIK